MGSNQSYGQDPTQHSKQMSSEVDYKIYASPSGQQYQKYSVMHDGNAYFQSKYRFRVQNDHKDLVRVIYAGSTPGLAVCTGWNKYDVVTERIPYRLDSLSSIQPRNSFAILSAALRGFRDLFKQDGAINVKQRMIGINREGRVKVWLNSNWAMNKPQEINISQGSQSQQEKHLVSTLFTMINSKTESDQLWNQFLQAKEQANPTSFNEFLQFIHKFAAFRSINIGDTVINIFNKSYYKQNATEHIHFAQQKQMVTTTVVNKNPGPLRRPFQEIQSKFVRQIDNSINHNQAAVEKRTQSIIIQQPRFTPPTIPTFYTNSQNPMKTQNIVRPIQITFNKTNLLASVPVFSIPPTTNHAIQLQTTTSFRPQRDFSKIKTSQSNYTLEINPSIQQLASVNNTNTKPQTHTNTEIEKCQQKIQIKQQQQPIKTVVLDNNEVEEAQQIFQTQKEQININNEQPQVEYQINIRQVSSEQSFHEQLASLLVDQIRQSKDIDIVEDTKQQNVLPNIQEIKASINPALVNTQQLKQQQNAKESALQEICNQKETDKFALKQRKNISYKQMRRMLLQNLQN